MTQTVYTSKEEVPIRVIVGVKNNWTLEFKNDDGSPKDISGYSFYGHIRDKEGGKQLAAFTFDQTQLANGILPFSISKSASESIGAMAGVYDILQEEDADTTNVVLLFRGDVEIQLARTVI